MPRAHDRDESFITLGVEEEFFLVDPVSRGLVGDPDPGILEISEKNSGPHRVVPEFLRSQIETNTCVCDSVAELRKAIRETRSIIIEAAAKYDTAVMAASTHPFAIFDTQLTTPKERYQHFANRFQENVRRFMIGGMHIHAGFGDEDSRLRVMTALRGYLPLLHALSASSPFNEGRETGFKSWRLTLVGGLPRTGIPRAFYSHAEYDELVREYQAMNFIENGSELWWDIRPSHAYPTIEMRICDICTRIDDAICVAALYASLIRMLSRLNREGKLPPEAHTEIISENRWMAQRYGVIAFFGDTEKEGGRHDIDEYLTELVDTLTPDAEALGCVDDVQRALTIVREGASADQQLDLYRLRRLEGASAEEALRDVVDQVIAQTREGI